MADKKTKESSKEKKNQPSITKILFVEFFLAGDNKCKREDFLPYKNKKAIDFNNKIYLKLSYDNSCDFIKPIIRSSFIECLKIKKEFTNLK
jgi:hypothetical protein